jgi:hypothetical protein
MWFYGQMRGRNHNEKSIDEIKAKYGVERVKTKSTNKITA